MEPRQALHGNKLRPDLLIHFVRNGQDAAFDHTIHNPLRNKESLKKAIKNDQEFLVQAEQDKRNKYQVECEKNDIVFLPIVLNAFGGILNESDREGIARLIHLVKKDRFVPPNWAAPKAYWYQRIAIALWAGNVVKVGPFLKNFPERLN